METLSHDDPFGPATLPYGAFIHAGEQTPRLGARLGEAVIDLPALASVTGFEHGGALDAPTLNPLLAQGFSAWSALRAWLTTTVDDPDQAATVQEHLIPLESVTMRLPFEVRDYVDFYASEHHARNVGQIFRPDSPSLPAAWKHLPIGYHGRSSTVVVDGTDIVRPTGQRKAPSEAEPAFGPSIRLDIEAELGFVCGGPTAVGETVPIGEAGRHIFGVVLLNDWSARDLQAWEYVPLGPFLGKSFATTISAWVTPYAALEHARCALPTAQDDPQLLPYLVGPQGDPSTQGIDVQLEVELVVDGQGTVLSRPGYRDMYYSPEQMLTHLASNGAAVSAGDLFGSGTISGAEPGSRGSLLELSWNGTQPIALEGGGRRGFLEDGDTVVMRAWAPGPDGARIGLGECRGTIRPARA